MESVKNIFMSKAKVIVIFLLLVLGIIGGAFFFSSEAAKKFVHSVRPSSIATVSSTPEQSPETPPTVEEVPTVAIETQQELKVLNIVKGDEVQSPVVIEGEAKASWFQDEKFPVLIWDSQERIIGNGVAQAKAEIDPRNLEEMIPFIATVDFTLSDLKTGYIVLQHRSPQGVVVSKGSVKIPVQFVQRSNMREQGGCYITGCSAQVCSDQETVTECSYKEEYICYQKAVCERQPDGKCGWTETKDLQICLQQFQ